MVHSPATDGSTGMALFGPEGEANKLTPRCRSASDPHISPNPLQGKRLASRELHPRVFTCQCPRRLTEARKTWRGRRHYARLVEAYAETPAAAAPRASPSVFQSTSPPRQKGQPMLADFRWWILTCRAKVWARAEPDTFLLFFLPRPPIHCSISHP
jgi:hypothetical protein